jgi:hypothetical protein
MKFVNKTEPKSVARLCLGKIFARCSDFLLFAFFSPSRRYLRAVRA